MKTKYFVDNAVILAAGRGRRLKTLTDHTPKPLLINVDNTPLIETIIKNLIAKKIKRIYIVVGYKKELFNYLVKKYPVKLIENNDWKNTNNISSLLAASPFLKNSLIINGDIVMKKNVFETSYPTAITYVEKNSNLDEWLIVTKNNQVKFIDVNGIGKCGYYHKEITFITNQISKLIKKEIKNFDNQKYFEFLILKITKNYQMPFSVHLIDKNLINDIDNLNDYQKFLDDKSVLL